MNNKARRFYLSCETYITFEFNFKENINVFSDIDYFILVYYFQ